MDGDADAVLTLPRPFTDSSNIDNSDLKNEKPGEEVKKRRTLEEILAAAEEEFELMDSPVDSAVKSLKSGKEIQRLSAIRNLTDLLDSEENYNEFVFRVLPVLQEVLAQEPSNLDIHCESAVVFKNIIKDTKYTHKYSGLTDKLLNCILRNLENQKENVTAAAWLESMVEIADSIPVQSVVDFIVPLAVSQAESTKRVQRRVISARLIEKLATIIPPEFVRRDLASCVQMLCQDSSPAVRTTIAQRISVVAQGLNNEADCVSMLLPCFIQLCKDDDAGVREAVLNAVAACLPYFTKESCKNAIMPLLKNCADQAMIMRDISLSVIARQLGSWLEALRDIFSSQDQKWFLDTYCRICEFSWRDSSSSSMLYLSCRRMCAYNFPCFAMVYGETHFTGNLMPILERFCKDADDEVRCTVASGFHEIVQLRSPSEQSALMAPFVELMCSGTAEVVQHLTGSLDRILPPLYNGFRHIVANDTPSSSVESKQLKPAQTSSNLVRRGSSGSTAASAIKTNSIRSPAKEQITRVQLDRILIGCNRVIRGTGSWRSHQSYLLNISVLRHLIPTLDLYTSFVPMLQQEVLTARALPCRIAAAQTLLLMMRDFSTVQKRSTIIEFFRKEIGEHQSCHRRRLLLDVTPIILEHFSREFFLKEFFSAVLKLANDKISNLRLQLCRLLSRIKTYLSFPVNDAELSQMERVVRDLLTSEQNANTRQLIQQFAVELSRAETDTKESRMNQSKLAEEKRLWTEKEPTSPKRGINENEGEVTIALGDPKANALRRSATTNLAKIPVLSEKAAKLAASIADLSACDENASTGATQQQARIARTSTSIATTCSRLSSPLSASGALPPSSWRTSRPDRPKMAIVRPQPQITITQRSPSPMPFNGDMKKDALDDRRSKLPLSRARYRSNSNVTTTDSNIEIRRKSLPEKPPSPSPKSNMDSPLKKYRPRSDMSMSRRTSSPTVKQSTSMYSRRSSSSAINKDSDVMTRSASSMLDGSGHRASSYSASSTSVNEYKNARRPYGLMKVQSTSAVERKPAHMSIRVISIS